MDAVGAVIALYALSGKGAIACLSRLAAARKPSVYPAWRPPANPAFIPLGGCPQTQHSSRLAVPQTLYSSRLAACREPSIHPAWRPAANLVFIPLGGLPRTQYSSRLAACRKPSVHPAWRPAANPVFTPLGGQPQTQYSSRLAAFSVTTGRVDSRLIHAMRFSKGEIVVVYKVATIQSSKMCA